MTSRYAEGEAAHAAAARIWPPAADRASRAPPQLQALTYSFTRTFRAVFSELM